MKRWMPTVPTAISIVSLVVALLALSGVGGAAVHALKSVGSTHTVTIVRQASAPAAQGTRGPRGPRGKRGLRGKRGPRGFRGPAGAKGATGARGATGLLGALNDVIGRPCTTSSAVRNGTVAAVNFYSVTPPADPSTAFGTGGGSGQASFSLVCEVPDRFEPNDSQQAAVVVPYSTGTMFGDGYYVAATIQPAGNDDWYQLGTATDHAALTRISFGDTTAHPASAQISVDGGAFVPLPSGCYTPSAGNIVRIKVTDPFSSGYNFQAYRSGTCP